MGVEVGAGVRVGAGVGVGTGGVGASSTAVEVAVGGGVGGTVGWGVGVVSRQAVSAMMPTRAKTAMAGVIFNIAPNENSWNGSVE